MCLNLQCHIRRLLVTEFSSPVGQAKAPASAFEKGMGWAAPLHGKPRTMKAQWSLIWGRLGAKGLRVQLHFPQKGSPVTAWRLSCCVAPSTDDSLGPQAFQPGVKKGQVEALAAVWYQPWLGLSLALGHLDPGAFKQDA